MNRKKKALKEDGEESIDVKDPGIILDKSSKSLKIPRHLLEDEKELFSIINREVLHQTDSEELKMNDVIGLNEAKEALEDSFIFPLHHPEIYKNQLSSDGIVGVLLTGPPGTGKTMIASALANLCKETVFFNVHASRYFLAKSQQIIVIVALLQFYYSRRFLVSLVLLQSALFCDSSFTSVGAFNQLLILL